MRRWVSDAILKGLALLSPRRRTPTENETLARIVIFRHGGLGDVIVTTGLAASIKRLYPDAQITFITSALCAPLLSHHPAIDEVVISDDLALSGGLRKSISSLVRMRRVTTPPFDAAFFTHVGVQRLACGLSCHSRYKIGPDIDGRGFAFAMTQAVPLYIRDHPLAQQSYNRHLNSLLHDLLRALVGADVEEAKPTLLVTDRERADAQGWLDERDLLPRFVILLPCGTSRTKLWPIDRYRALARRLSERGLGVLVMGGADEAKLADDFQDLGSKVVFAANDFSIRQSLAILTWADLAIGNDTGMMHAAAALNVKTLGLFGASPDWAFGYHGIRNRILKGTLPCIPCNLDTCALLDAAHQGETAPCMAEIDLESVADTARELLELGPVPGRTEQVLK